MSEMESRKVIIPVEFENPENPEDGDEVILTIDGKPTKCVFRDFSRFDFSRTNPEIRYIVKIQPSIVKEAEGGEEIKTTTDGITTARIAKKGQMIVQNVRVDGTKEPGYIYGNLNDDVAAQAAEFALMYQAVSEDQLAQLEQKFPNLQPGEKFLRKRPIPLASIRVNEPTAIKGSWGGMMGTPAGGYVTKAGYTIHPQSMEDYYRVVEMSELLDKDKQG